MAYSDYGGYGYRNGERVEARSDAVLSPSGLQSTPGQWPGWTIEAGRNGGSYHVIIGDGPIFVGLHKQSGLHIHRAMDEVPLLDIIDESCKKPGWFEEYNGNRYLNEDHFKESGDVCSFTVDGNRIDVYWRIEDNHYQYVRLTQPDGTVWTAFSGYGVGAGLESEGYGYSTGDRHDVLFELFPNEAHSSQPALRFGKAGQDDAAKIREIERGEDERD